MKNAIRFALALSVFVAGVAHAQVGPPFSENQACSAGSCTRGIPDPNNDTVPASSGAELSTATGFRVSICAAAGQTLSGAGTLLAWRYNSNAGKWERNKGLDLTVAVSAVQCAAFPDVEVAALVLKDRVLYATSGVTVSGGATATVWIVLSDRRK